MVTEAGYNVEQQLVEATERAIAKVIGDFQDYPDRFWNERDIHWSLFYYLKREAVVQESYGGGTK